MNLRRMCAFLVLAAVLATAMAVPWPAAAVTVGPGVVFQPSASWANISFATSHTFTSIRVDATGVAFDSVRLGVAKQPQAMPRATLVISTWTPYQTTENATVVRFSGDALPGSNLSFSLAGVIPAREYVLQVDGAEASRVLSDGSGFVPFWWADFSIHDFHVTLGWRTGTPPVPPPLSADFTFAPANPSEGDSVSFSAAAAGGVPPYAFAWDFGDGASGTGSMTSHAFAAAGDYAVNLTVTDARGRPAWAEKTVPVQATPQPPTLSADFTFVPASPEAGDVVAFSAAASGGTPPYDYSWDFGDGGIGVGPNPSHAYTIADTYDVTLTVSDARPVDVVVVHAVTVRPQAPPPSKGNVTAAFDYTIDGTTVRFVDRSTTDTGAPIATWSWFFGDGTNSSEPSPTHMYAVPGFSASYNVILVVCVTAEQCKATAQLITFYNVPLIGSFIVVVVALLLALLALILHRRKEEPRKPTEPKEPEG